jgi:hypothetical protein
VQCGAGKGIGCQRTREVVRLSHHDGVLGLRTVRLTGTAVRGRSGDGYGITVHRPSKRVSEGLTVTDGDGDGRTTVYGCGRVLLYYIKKGPQRHTQEGGRGGVVEDDLKGGRRG